MVKKTILNEEELEEISFFGVLEDFEQIILNLLDNSIKHSISNEISIQLYKENENILLKMKNKSLEEYI